VAGFDAKFRTFFQHHSECCEGCLNSKQAAAACAIAMQHLPHLMPQCFSALASLETSSFLFAHLCSHDTKHTACSQALGSFSAAEASTFAAE